MAAEIKKIRKAASYGWGVIPVEARITGVSFTTSLFPKDETYLLPLKLAVRQRLALTADDEVSSLRARALFSLGTIVYPMGDAKRCETLSEQALAIYRTLGDRHGPPAARRRRRG